MKLYHYTTIDVLALILKHRTLRFNCLANVDDQDEAETSDFGSFKNYLFVSCWTEDNSENISLWNMYSKNMEGVRIGIDSAKINFLPKERLQIPLYHLVDNVKPENSNSAFILWLASNNLGSFDPKITVRYDLEDNYKFKLVVSDNYYRYNFIDLASRKRKEWFFQKEIRYVLFGASTKNLGNDYSHQSIINSITEKEELHCEFVDLLLNDQFFENIEILMGPLCKESDKIICESLLEQYVGKGQYSLRSSLLNIKNKGNIQKNG